MPLEHWMHVCWQYEPAAAVLAVVAVLAGVYMLDCMLFPTLYTLDCMLFPKFKPSDQSEPPVRPAAERGIQSTIPNLSVTCVHSGLMPSLRQREKRERNEEERRGKACRHHRRKRIQMVEMVPQGIMLREGTCHCSPCHIWGFPVRAKVSV